MTIKPIIVIACLLGFSQPGMAQTSRSTTTDCAPTQARPNDPNGITTTGRSDQPLSDKLATSGGVLCPPPAVDPDIRVPAPSTGSNMPVVPPPGSPGGDPDLKPK